MKLLSSALALCMVVCCFAQADDNKCGCSKPKPVQPQQVAKPQPQKSACAPAPEKKDCPQPKA